MYTIEDGRNIFLWNRVLTSRMSWLISFTWPFSRCEEREQSDNYKMKNPCPEWDLNHDPCLRKPSHCLLY